ncbi:MAG: hypothetical protein Q4C54_07110 [Clostridia bacterium]|nr:hypothetical protein [Clostridia bacterium]
MKQLFSRKNAPGLVLFAAFWLIYTLAAFRLFYAQCTAVLDGTRTAAYNSDMWAYIPEMLGQKAAPTPFPYPILFLLGRLFHLVMGPAAAMACATTLLVSLSVAAVFAGLACTLLPRLKSIRDGYAPAILTALAAMAVFLSAMLMLPGEGHLPGLKYDYVGVGTPSPWHNATYLAARPFAVAAFFLLCRLLEVYETEGFASHKGLYIGFAAALVLTTLAKPSYTLLVCITAACVMLYRLFRTRWRTFGKAFALGLAFVPTAAVMLWQFFIRFTPGAEPGGGITFGLGDAWLLYVDSIPLAVLYAIAFPLVTLLTHLPRLKTNTHFRFAWLQYLVALLMAYFLKEGGSGLRDFNFFWGYMCGLLFLFVVSAEALAEDIARWPQRKAAVIAQSIMLLCHIAGGVCYYVALMQGKMYF